MIKAEKPVLGPKPYWLVHEQRIVELAEAVLRCIRETAGPVDYELLGRFGYEIWELSGLVEGLQQMSKDTTRHNWQS